METQGSFLNGAGPSPPLPDATKEAEKEETREGEGVEEEQQQRVEEEDFPGEEEKKERIENKEEEGGDEEAPTTTTTTIETDVKKAKKKKKGKKAVFNQVSPFVRNVVNLLRQAESTELYRRKVKYVFTTRVDGHSADSEGVPRRVRRAPTKSCSTVSITKVIGERGDD
jgi:hypothetical protein